MRVWIGIKKDGEYVHEWEEDMPGDDAVWAVTRALKDYQNRTGDTLWGLTIMVDRNRQAEQAKLATLRQL
jgi:hypothetical protein